MFDYYIWLSSLKNRTFKSCSSRDKLTISIIPLSSKEKSSIAIFAIFYSLNSFLLHFEEFSEEKAKISMDKY